MPVSDDNIVAHRNDGRDADECYRVFMAERSTLISVQREIEDNFKKTIIQLAVASLIVITGFVTQASVNLKNHIFAFTALLIFLIITIFIGLAEQFITAKAYESLLRILDDFYNRRTNDLPIPKENAIIRYLQLASFGFFTVGLLLLGVIAFAQAKEKINDGQRKDSSSSSAAAPSPAGSSAAAASCERGSPCSKRRSIGS